MIPPTACRWRYLIYISDLQEQNLSVTLLAAFSTLQAAFSASFLVGLFCGIIITATAPTIAPKPMESTMLFVFISFTPFCYSIPKQNVSNA